jgi:hypothetical protein
MRDVSAAAVKHDLSAALYHVISGACLTVSDSQSEKRKCYQ